MLTRRSKLVLLISLILCGSTAALYSFIQKKYVLDKNIKFPYQIAPEFSSFYIEFSSLESARNLWLESKLYTELSPSARSSAFFSLRTFTYFLQIKAGLPLNTEQIFTFFSGPAGFGFDQSGNQYAITKINPGSQFGIAFAAAMSGSAVNIPTVLNEPIKSKDKAINSDTYKRSFPANNLQLNNLKGFKITYQGKPIYFALLSNYLVVAEDLDLLSVILENAGSERSGVLSEYADLREDYNQHLGFIVWENQLLPSLSFGASAGAGLISSGKNTITVDLYLKNMRAQGSSLKVTDLKAVSMDSAIGLLNSNSNYESLVDILEKEDDKKANHLVKYLASMNFKSTDSGQSGFGLIFHGFDLDTEKKKITPQFSMRLGGATAHELAQQIFNRNEHKGLQVQDIDSIVYKSKAPQRYNLMRYKAEEGEWLFSAESSMVSHLKANRGMTPVLSDLLMEVDEQFKQPDSIFFINGNKLLNNLEYFYTYGALKSSHYSEKTIKNEISPVLQALKKDYYLVAATKGKKGQMKIFQK
jgi:hypothetical protein